MKEESGSQPNGAPKFNAADAWLFVGALGRNWVWLLLGGAVFAAAGLWCGLFFWHSTYSASAQLLRYDARHLTAVLGDQTMAPETFASLLRAPELLERVAARTQPRLSAGSLSKNVSANPERNSDVIVVSASAKDRQAVSTGEGRNENCASRRVGRWSAHRFFQSA